MHRAVVREGVEVVRLIEAAQRREVEVAHVGHYSTGRGHLPARAAGGGDC
jgi:hypothetical protein